MRIRDRSSTTTGTSPLRRLLVGLALIGALATAVLLAVDFNGDPLASASSSAARDSGSDDDGDKSNSGKGKSGKTDDDDSSGDDANGDDANGDDANGDDANGDDDSGSDDSGSDDGDDSDSSDDDDFEGLPPSYADCEPAKLTQPFAPWGDTADYAEVANGSFEDGLTGWDITGSSASLVPTDRGIVLQVSGGTKVLSPPICFDETRPHAKMFTHILAGKYETGEIEVEVHYDRVNGGAKKIDVSDFDQSKSSTTGWKPSPELGTALGGVRKLAQPDANGHRWFQFEFKVKGKANWQLDDLFVDPRRRS